MKDRDVIDFIYEEAFVLDGMRWESWLEMFLPDGRYWMPLEWQQTDPRLQPSLMYEDLLLLKVRVERLAGDRTFSQKPKSRCHHLLQEPRILALDGEAGTATARTSYIYTETRGDAVERFSGWVTHELETAGAGLKIKLKRIDLINFDAPFGNIQLFI